MQYYKPHNTNFNTNGDIVLKSTMAVLKIELNGVSEVEIEHPYDDIGRWKLIEKFAVIKTDVCYTSNKQLFRIYSIGKGMFGLIIKARHIFFDLVNEIILDKRAINTNGFTALHKILEDTKFKAFSDIEIKTTCYFNTTNCIAAINGDTDNTFLKRWGGELFLDNFNVHINNKIGNDYGVKIKYSKNMEDVDLIENTDNIITRIYPIAANNIMLPEKHIDSSLLTSYPIIFNKIVKMDDIKLKDINNDENSYSTLEDVYKEMRLRCENIYASGVDKPKISGNVNLIALENTIEYKDFKNLVNIGIGDIITIEHSRANILTKSRCVGLEWDILAKKYININIGEITENYFDNSDKYDDKLNNILTDNGNVKSDMLSGIIDGFKTKFQAQRDIAQQQQVRAMLFEDKIKGSKTYGALCLGSMGLEIAGERTPDDKDWNWQTFITGKEVVADYLVGKLKTVLIENIDGSFQIDLSKGGGMDFYNNGKQAINISNNLINFYDWKHAGRNIGFIGSTVSMDGKDTPYLSISNTPQNVIDISFRNDSGTYTSYIEFDQYNLQQQKFFKPIQFYGETNFNWKHLYRAQLANDDNSGWIYVNNERAELSYGDYFIDCKKDRALIGKSGGSQVVIKDDGIHFYGQLFKGD